MEEGTHGDVEMEIGDYIEDKESNGYLYLASKTKFYQLSAAMAPHIEIPFQLERIQRM